MNINLLVIVAILSIASCNSNNNSNLTDKNDSINVSSSTRINGDSISTKSLAVSKRDSHDTTKILGNKEEILSESTLSCEDVISKLIIGSNLKQELKQFNIGIDEIDSNVITIKMFNTNDLGVDVPIALLQIDGNKKELRDITADLENPKKLRFQMKYMDLILEKCLGIKGSDSNKPTN
jgi:hypothetical protein